MKFKSKSLISIMLSIMMVISMIIVAIPANAAVVDNEPVGAGPYYLWYTTGDKPNFWEGGYTCVPMTQNGNDYTASFTESLNVNSIFVVYISTSATSIADGEDAMSGVSSPTYDPSSSFGWQNFYTQGYNDKNYKYIKCQLNAALKVKVTFNDEYNTVALSSDSGSTNSYEVNFGSGTGGTGTGKVTAKKTADSTTISTGASVESGTNVTFTATPDANSKFDGWYSTQDCSGTALSTSNPYSIDVTGVTNVYAKFTSTATPTTQYYIGGRFRVKNSSGTFVYTYDTNTSAPWKADSTTGFELTDEDGDGVYTLDTGCTVAELSQNLPNSDSSTPPYFLIHTGSGDGGTNVWYGAEGSTNTTFHDFQTNTVSNKANLIKKTGNNEVSNLINFSDTTDAIKGTVTICFKPIDDNTNELWYTTAGVDGDIIITDKTDVNGSLAFSVENKTSGTADLGDTVEITATPDAYFSLSKVKISYTDANGVSQTLTSSKIADNKCTFTIPSEATFKKKEISIKGTFTLDKQAYVNAQGDGLWIDVAPSETDTTATLIKWNNYSGSNHDTSNPYTFYVPKNVDLANAVIYNVTGSAVTIDEKTIANKDKYEGVSLSIGNNAITGGSVSNVKVMQGSTDAMFLTTSTKLPTALNSSVSTDNDAKEYKKQVNYSGGSCKTMSNDAATASFSSALGLDSIKGRGNSSWKASAQVFGKYAFNMKLKSKTKLLGMDESSGAKSWCLLANNADESMLRNALTYQLADEIGLAYSPEFRFVDIYDNGEYMGQYLVTEKVDVGTSKLIKGESFEDLNEDVLGDTEIDKTLSENATYKYTDSNGTEYTPKMRYATVGTGTFEYKTTGVYLLEFEIAERVADEPCYFVSPHNQNVVVKSPEYATKEQVEYIAKKFAAMEEVAFKSGATKAELSGVMDVESFAKMYLIQELSSNLDAASTSYYITFDCSKNDANGNGAVFAANPVWDYDWAYGQYNNIANKLDVDGNKLDTAGTDSWVAKNKAMDDSTVSSKGRSLQSQLAGTNEAFKTEIRKQWEGTNGFYAAIKKYYSTGGQISTWKDKILSSVDMNETRWGFIAGDLLSGWGTTDTGDTFDGENGSVASLNTWVTKRAAWLNTQFSVDSEYPPYTPAVPTIKLYYADGTTEITGDTPSVSQGAGFVIKVTSALEDGVVYRLYKGGTLVGTDSANGKFAIATDSFTIGDTYTYTVKAVFNGRASDDSKSVSVLINERAGTKEVTIYFKSASASAYVPSLSVDNAAASVMTRTPKTAVTNGTYFGSTYSGSLKFYWFFTKVKLDTSVTHTLKFTTKDNRVNASDSYMLNTASDNNYYFAVDNLMGDTTLVNLTGKEEYIRNYHISATHMVYASKESDGNIGFTWADDNGTYKEFAMGTYLEERVNAASLTDRMSTSLLTIPSALTPNAMLLASSASPFFTVKSATLAQRIAAEAEDVSTLQYQLLDVNLDGIVDVKDSTMMQKALANI